MKPVVSAGNAWVCVVISAFALVILPPIALLFRSNHEAFMGRTQDPKDGAAVARTVFMAALVYLFTFVFCGWQAWLGMGVREGRVAL
ncbi:hypothetical protein DFH27DRAFT_608638 [Peziza echinospora]|nr:hypothetical protein DFH27DRAFT_608638 [Peziza echinospora]